jgi:hypothetical protein
MMSKGLKIVTTVLFCAAMPTLVGCACGGVGLSTASYGCGSKCKTTSTATVSTFNLGLPPNPVVGECYALTVTAPLFETVSERVCVKEATERIEIVPAQYEWVEEKVVVKEASTHFVEVPAQFEMQEKTVTASPGHTGWVKESSARCVSESNKPTRDIFCLVSSPPTTQTIRTQVMVKAASLEKTTIPAEYQTVRRQKLICPATTRKISIPAEYDEVTKTIAKGPGKMQWERVLCQIDVTTDKVNAVKDALAAKGYTPGPQNGQLADADWAALKSYQEKNGLGVGELTYETLNSLGVSEK